MDYHKLNNLPYKSRHDNYITYLNTQDFHGDINTNTMRKQFVDSMVAFSIDDHNGPSDRENEFYR